MRGRTNVNNGGIILNATTDTYEVESGETIIAGDFVDRITKTEGGTSVPQGAIFQVSDNNYVVVNSIIQDNGDHTFTRIGSTGINKYPRFQIGTDEFISFEIGVNAPNGWVTINLIKYEALNYCVTRSLSYQFVSSWAYRAGGVYAIQISEKVFMLFLTYNGKNNNTNKYGNCFKVVKLTISGTNYSDYTHTGQIVYTEENYTLSTEPNLQYVGWGILIQNNDYLVGIYGNQERQYYDTAMVSMKRIKGASSATSKSISSTAIMRPLGTVTDDGYIGFIEMSGGKLYQRYLYVDKNDINSYNLYDSVFIKDLPDYDSATYKFTPLKIENDTSGYDRYIIVQLTSKKYLTTAEVYISQTDRDIIINDFTILASYSQPETVQSTDVSFIHKRGVNDYLIIEDYKLLETTIVNHVVEGEVNTHRYVREIYSLDYILGVAKQNGTAGDTIEVYVPSINS